jgi:arylsulfatase A-like enzyme
MRLTSVSTALALALLAPLGRATAAQPRLAPAAAAAKPNVLLVAVDDLNTWVGHLGRHPDARTPNLDRLARRGVTFTRAYAPAPVCNPSRAALLSGRRPSTTGIYDNAQPWSPTLAKLPTLPLTFARHGYEVKGGGKIFHDEGDGSQDAYFPDGVWKPRGGPTPPAGAGSGLGRAHFDWATLDAPDDVMPDHQLASWAAAELGRPHERPLFLAVGFSKPHLPWYVPKAHVDLFPEAKVRLPEVKADDLADLPPPALKMASPEGDHAAVVRAGQWRRAVAHYLAAIHFVDAQIGRVLDALLAGPHAKNTIVVLFGDHGWHLGQKQHWRKFTLWEEATRAPLIFAGLGVRRPGACDRPVDFMTLFPTLLDLTGLPPVPGIEGRSLRPLLADPKAAWDAPALTTHGRGNHAVRTERHRYIRYADGSEELYDEAKDPNEWTNLAQTPKTEATRKALAAFLPTNDAPPVPRGAAGKRASREPGAREGAEGASAVH